MILEKIAKITGFITATTALISAVYLLISEAKKIYTPDAPPDVPLLAPDPIVTPINDGQTKVTINGNDIIYTNPRTNSMVVDICKAKDKNCIDRGDGQGNKAAQAWCKEKGHPTSKEYAISNTIENRDAWRVGGDYSTTCNIGCKYFTSITCIRS